MVDKARKLALKAIVEIEKEEGYSNLVLNNIINENRKNLTEKDISLISELVYGVITWKITLDEIIKKYSKIKLKKISIWILNVLRIGIYQIIFLDKIPKSAAVNESVNLAKRYGHRASSNYVNAILRKVEKDDYEKLNEIENETERISKMYSMPEWIIEELKINRNLEEVEKICQNLTKKPKINIRVNTLKITVEKLKEKLEEQKIKYKEIDQEMPEFLELEKIKDIENNQLFKEGYFTVQDISAGLTAKILSPKENENILDTCAAPGGKTTYMAELMNNKGNITTRDIYENRIKLIKEKTKRLGIKIIKTEEIDASKYKEEYKEKFDKILLDVPCLGIGVIKRKPDIKWQRKKEDVQEISKLQKAILDNCSKYLKKGGELVYSTCSILKEENEDVIQKFIKENKNFEIAKTEINIKLFEKFHKKEGYFSINPTEKNDGFFICKLTKNNITII